jgi:two-component system phosphate regulon sensor histidine kinase PhoR
LTSAKTILRIAFPMAGMVVVAFAAGAMFGAGGAVLGWVLGIGLVASWALAWWFTLPVRRLARAAEAFEQLPPGIGGNEVDLILRRFEAARRRLDEQLTTITHDRNKLTAILSSMVEGVLAVDAEERLVHVNQVAIAQLGLATSQEDGDLRGRPIHELTRQRQVLEALTEAVTHQRAVNALFHVAEGAAERVLELSATPLRNGRRGTLGAVLVLHDVTQLQRLEGMRREFVSNVSHELKTPLTAIRGFVETMTDTPDLEPEIRQRFLHKIAAQTARLTALVTDLLSLSRIESSPGERSLVDLRGPFMESLRTLRPVIEERQIRFSYELPDAAVTLIGDAEAFRQAFSNLIDNAVKYTPPGGGVQVALLHHSGPRECIVFEVRDEGPGIAAKHLPRVFERFYRADKARSRELGGTGLGLAIVKNVAVNSGGTVEVDSEPGRGSTFRMVWRGAEELARPTGTGSTEAASASAPVET